ncbi:hypothetical protein ON010_g18548 [Phytophthora cinnamomi]|nr:hypothetical protein ON010_g18548 [Phytophthora cinnamomi]
MRLLIPGALCALRLPFYWRNWQKPGAVGAARHFSAPRQQANAYVVGMDARYATRTRGVTRLLACRTRQVALLPLPLPARISLREVGTVALEVPLASATGRCGAHRGRRDATDPSFLCPRECRALQKRASILLIGDQIPAPPICLGRAAATAPAEAARTPPRSVRLDNGVDDCRQ